MSKNTTILDPQTDAPSIDPHAIEITSTTVAHLLSGKAVFTLQSKATGARFTYQIKKKQDDGGSDPVFFVSLLTGPQNTSDYSYLAFMGADLSPRLTAKSCVKQDAPSWKAFAWTWGHLCQGHTDLLTPQVEVWHEGRCFRCGRALTVPSSIHTGLGPVCASAM
jgi:hypothetical protein